MGKVVQMALWKEFSCTKMVVFESDISEVVPGVLIDNVSALIKVMVCYRKDD